MTSMNDFYTWVDWMDEWTHEIHTISHTHTHTHSHTIYVIIKQTLLVVSITTTINIVGHSNNLSCMISPLVMTTTMMASAQLILNTTRDDIHLKSPRSHPSHFTSLHCCSPFILKCWKGFKMKTVNVQQPYIVKY